MMSKWRHSVAAIAFLTQLGILTHASQYNVKEYGARGDRKSENTTAIQAAINACNKAGGGTVYIPPGDYLSGNIHLLSDVNLHLDAGATIWASRKPRACRPRLDYRRGRTAHIR